MSSRPITKISKFLSYILRHHPEKIGLELDRHGWAHLPTLIQKARAHNRKIRFEDIEEVIASSKKSRFLLSQDREYIRASYGHSIPVEMSTEPREPPKTLFHGTAEKNKKSILEKGLHPAGRNFVHLSLDREDAASVGRRHGEPIIFSIEARKMHHSGYAFYQSKSESGIWLVKEVPPRFIQKK